MEMQQIPRKSIIPSMRILGEYILYCTTTFFYQIICPNFVLYNNVLLSNYMSNQLVILLMLDFFVLF